MRKIFSADTIKSLEKQYRTNLINSLPGFRGANLIGTINAEGKSNLAIFNSVTHIGANPPLMGFIMRPLTGESRHTYHNIQARGYFTINHVHHTFTSKAHQTAARYSEEVSEFDDCGLTPEFTDTITAPYVAESQIKIGLQLADEVPIALNQTILMIGEVIEVILDEEWLAADGFVYLDKAGSMAVTGLDAYSQPKGYTRYAYAKPGKTLEQLRDDK